MLSVGNIFHFPYEDVVSFNSETDAPAIDFVAGFSVTDFSASTQMKNIAEMNIMIKILKVNLEAIVASVHWSVNRRWLIFSQI